MLSRAVPLGNGAAQGCGNSGHDATMPSHRWWEQALTTVQGNDVDLRAVKVHHRVPGRASRHT